MTTPSSSSCRCASRGFKGQTVPLLTFRAENFRCLENIEFEADSDYNLIYGANASGKTSLLEALAYLGRGKSFRGAPTTSLIRHGANEFLLYGTTRRGEHTASVGVRNGRKGLEVRIDGRSDGGSAALAELLPLQIIDPNVHNLVAGGPEERRRYIDWIAFHVEPGFLPEWRCFRRALRQRNAVLRAGGDGLDAWNNEFVERGMKLDAARRTVLAASTGCLEKHGHALLGSPVRYEYRPGWAQQQTLAEALKDGLTRDLQQGSSQAGPHRADIRLIYDDRQARQLVSRGQQKLLACAMILGATEAVQTHQEQPMLLLLDDPAAELDGESLERLMMQVFGLGSQLVVTALEPMALDFPESPAVFHVKHGQLTRRP